MQTLGASGTARIFRQGAGGSLTPVTVPRTAASTSIVTALGPRLLLSAVPYGQPATDMIFAFGCGGGA